MHCVINLTFIYIKSVSFYRHRLFLLTFYIIYIIIINGGEEMYKSFFKRLIDVILSLLGIIVLSPLFILISILIKLDSKGPVIFKQERIGLDAQLFNIYKFRSMCVGAEKIGTGQYSFSGDPRVTRVGKLLRATSLDEIPQLFNILKGDMSFVGPRPPLTYHPWPIEEYTDEQMRMFEVRPGISGWAQVNGRKEVEWHERIRLNVWYVDNCSLALDIKIIFLTFVKVFNNDDNVNNSITVVGDAEEKINTNESVNV